MLQLGLGLGTGDGMLSSLSVNATDMCSLGLHALSMSDVSMTSSVVKKVDPIGIGRCWYYEYNFNLQTRCPFRVHAGDVIYQLSHQNIFAMSSFKRYDDFWGTPL